MAAASIMVVRAAPGSPCLLPARPHPKNESTQIVLDKVRFPENERIPETPQKLLMRVYRTLQKPNKLDHPFAAG
jgi:hypothetical protein